VSRNSLKYTSLLFPSSDSPQDISLLAITHAAHVRTEVIMWCCTAHNI